MSIRFPIELAAAAEYAERAVDTIFSRAPTAREVRIADATPCRTDVRFEARRDHAGLVWTVFDVWAGKSASIRGVDQIGLSAKKAEDLADYLNRLGGLVQSKRGLIHPH